MRSAWPVRNQSDSIEEKIGVGSSPRVGAGGSAIGSDAGLERVVLSLRAARVRLAVLAALVVLTVEPRLAGALLGAVRPAAELAVLRLRRGRELTGALAPDGQGPGARVERVLAVALLRLLLRGPVRDAQRAARPTLRQAAGAPGKGRGRELGRSPRRGPPGTGRCHRVRPAAAREGARVTGPTTLTRRHETIVANGRELLVSPGPPCGGIENEPVSPGRPP